MRRLLIVLSTLTFVFTLPGLALGYWLASDSTGSARAVAAVLPTGLAPITISVTGHSVTIAVPAVTAPVDGYLVRRYRVGGGLASSFRCDTRCVESDVPDGSWVYTDLPLLASWQGGESPAGPPIQIDTTAPVLTVTSPAATNDRTPLLTGTAGVAPGDAQSVTVRLLAGSRVLLIRTVPVLTGHWQITAGRLSPQRSYTVSVEQSDAAGNVGQARSAFVLDTIAPPVRLDPVSWPVLGGRAGDAGASTRTSADSATVDVQIFRKGKLISTLTATRVGPRWQVRGSALASGRYTARAVQRDAAGNVSVSNIRAFSVDGTPPSVSVAAPAYLNTLTPTVTGRAGTADGDRPSVLLRVLADGVEVQRLTVQANSSAWSAQLRPLEPNRRYQVLASQIDAAGNVGSATASFVLDTAPPTVQAGIAVGVLSGIAGTVRAGETTSADADAVQVFIYAGEQVAATFDVPVLDGRFSTVLPTLAPGAYTAVVQQTDAAGNVGRSDPIEITAPRTN